MKRRLLIAAAIALAAGGQALAADLPQPPYPAPYVPPPVPVFTWTGVYLGINGGYGFGTSNWTAPPPNTSTGNFTTGGGLVGGTLGGNYQWGGLVLGIEADGDWQNLNGTTYSLCGVGCQTQSDWLATVRGRAGWAFDRVLVYGTGGGAFGNVQAGTVAGGLFQSATQTGWTAGAGVEYAFTPNLTAKVEYLYVDLGNMSCGQPSCLNGTSVSFTENVVRAGLNFKFNPW